MCSCLNELSGTSRSILNLGAKAKSLVCDTSSVRHPTKAQEEACFQILRLLHHNPELTQRELGVQVGISLGAVNYCLKALTAKGLVKASNFRASRNKSRYAYFLTPAGIAQKSEMTARFLRLKIAEYHRIKEQIDALSDEMVPRGLL